MSSTIDIAYIRTYENNVRHLAQQGVSRIRPLVMEKNPGSAGHYFERLGKAADPSQKTRSHAGTATPNTDTPWSRRLVTVGTWHAGDSTEQEDVIQMLVDPNSNIAQAQGKSFARHYDRRLLRALVYDDATSVNAAGTASAVTFASNAAQTKGSATAVLTFDLITEVAEQFLQNDIDPDEEKFWILGPRQARKLMQLTEATSGDYNTVKPLADKGIVRNWMGFTWIVSNRLPNPADGTEATTSTQIFNAVFTRRAAGLIVDRDISTRVAEDPTLSFLWRIYTHTTFGATRVEDEHVIRVHLDNTTL